MKTFLLTCAIACATISVASAANGQPLKLTRTIPLPGVEGRIDHFAFDPADHRLFICALGNNTVEVVDLGRGERIRSITGLGSPQGIAYLPELDRLLVATDEGGICKIFDGKSFQQVGELNLKDDADNVRYDDVAKRIYVGFGNGGIAIVEASNGKQTASIKLSAHPEAFELEKNGKLIFVNVPNARHVAVVDRDKGRVVATWKTDLVLANFPMALDETNHRLFVGCRLPSKLVVLNTDTGNVAAKINVSSDADDLFYDAKRHRIYAVCGEGKVDIIDQTDADTYKILAKIDTAGGARTGFFIPSQDELLVAVPRHGSQGAQIRVYDIE
jgi:DNA-binding beta-propeller fold protein YncE